MRRGLGDRRPAGRWRTRRGPAATLTATLAVLAVLTAGCGIGGDGSGGGGGGEVLRGLQVPTGLDEGCGGEATTSSADVAGDRTVARCASGAPEAVPLPAPTTLRVGVRERTEALAPVLLADELDQFAEENLTVELVELEDPAALFEALRRGEVDAVAGDTDAAFFDSVHQGSDARWVLGGAVPGAAGDVATAQPGLWLRSDATGGSERWRDLQGHRIAVQDGIGDVAVYPITGLVRQDDLTLNDVNLVPVGGDAAVEQLVGGDVSAAWLPDPHWRDVAGRGGMRLVTTLPPEPLGGVFLSGRLVDEARDRAVGVAFVRAVIRTINTYLADDYQSDDDVVAALADATGQDEDEITATPEWVFDWELRRDTTGRIQTVVVELGGVLYEEPIPESSLVDRSLYRDAVGA